MKDTKNQNAVVVFLRSLFAKSKQELDGKVITDVRELGIVRTAILSVQHDFSMMGSTVLVPILVMMYFTQACGSGYTRGPLVSVTLFTAGVGTILFHHITKRKVPAFLGSSFAFLGGYATVANLNVGRFADMDPTTKVAYANGGAIFAALLYVVMAFVIVVVGTERVMKVFSPIVTGTIIICIGITLAPSAIDNIMTNPWLAIIAISVYILVQRRCRGFMQLIPILLSIVVSCVSALIFNALGLTNVDGSAIMNLSSVASAPYVGIPGFLFPKFAIEPILIMAPIALSTMMEHIGDISSIAGITRKELLRDPGLWRTLLGDGLATLFALLFGGPPNTTYGENTSTMIATRVQDPKVMYYAGIIAVVMSLFPKVSEAIATMPSAIVGGISLILYGMIASVGVRSFVENNVDLKSNRNLIIFALTISTGIGFSVRGGLSFTVAGISVTLTGLTIATIVAIILNVILKDHPKESAETATNA